MPLLSRSLRSLLLLALPSRARCDSFSLAPRRPFPLSQGLPPGFSPSPPLATFSVGSDRALMRTSFSADVLPPPPFLDPPSPPRLIHIHAVVIVCRLPAGGHYYTSCARSRHRERQRRQQHSSSPTCLLLCPPALFSASLVLASLRLWRGSSPRVSVNANPRFTTVSLNNLQTYHALPAGGRGFFICLPLAGVCK